MAMAPGVVFVEALPSRISPPQEPALGSSLGLVTSSAWAVKMIGFCAVPVAWICPPRATMSAVDCSRRPGLPLTTVPGWMVSTWSALTKTLFCKT